jgi:hypothetical protein
MGGFENVSDTVPYGWKDNYMVWQLGVQEKSPVDVKVTYILPFSLEFVKLLFIQS